MHRVIMNAMLISAVIGASTVMAQEAREPVAGDRVRIRAQQSSGKVLLRKGIVREVTDSTIVMVPAEGWQSRSVMLADVRGVEIGTGKRNYGKGAGRGALWGGLAGLTLGAISIQDNECEGWGCLMAPSDEELLIGGTLLGTIIGTLVGLAAAPEKYVTAEVPSTRVGAARMPDGRIGLTVSRRL